VTDHFAAVETMIFVAHGKLSGSPLETLNRVFRKAMLRSGCPTQSVPPLSRSNLRVELLDMEPAKLIGLVTRPPRDRSRKIWKKVRSYPDNPVVVFRWEGRDHLVDGNRRVIYFDEIAAPSVKVYLCQIR
jgi:hypothetical protein